MSDRYDGIEPDIADLLDDSLTPTGDIPDFNNLMGLSGMDGEAETGGGSEEGPVKDCFDEIIQFEQPPQKYFYNPNYYKIALSGEGEPSQKLHATLAKFLKAEVPEDKTRFRMRIISIYWDYLRSLAKKTGPAMKLPKKLTLRYGALLPTLFSPAQRDMISRIIFENNTGEPVHYLDEWLKLISIGRLNPLATDEVQISKQSGDQKLKNSLERARGSQEANITMIQSLNQQRKSLESNLKERVSNLMYHRNHGTHTDLELPLTDQQRGSLPHITQLMSQLSRLDRDLKANFEKLSETAKDMDRLNNRVQELGGEAAVDTSVLAKEMDSLRQLAKMCVGRQGNHFPILMKQYFPSNLQFLGTRENVLREMRWIEGIDPGAFRRMFRQKSNRIVPNVILIPCYGDTGVCWEPFEKYNKGTSRGRIGIPMYPKNLKEVVLTAVADLRWQVAKEKAAHYWMEEGLTGHYYDWFTKMKLKGDVKDKFIEDYCLWISKESEGVQKLHKDVRAIFWRLAPYPQELKEKLKNRGFVYSELCKRDDNRARSDGY